MASMTTSLKNGNMLLWIGGAAILLIAAALMTPNLMRVNNARYYATSESGRESSARGDSRDALLSVAKQAKAELATTDTGGHPAGFDRKIIGTGSLEAVVTSPSDTAEEIRVLAEGLGGYIESSRIGGARNASTAVLTIRVPAARFNDAKSGVHKLVARVESENTEATDVTKQYVDIQARIRNLRAQEAQYLQIMKSAVKIPDMLEVSQKLSDVRGQIEQQQAEFETLSKQVETVALAVTLRAEADAQVFGLNWRPLYELKQSARDGLNSLASYTVTMLAIVFQLPAVLLSVGTIVLGAAASWKVLRWIGRTFFDFPKTTPEKA